MKLGCFSVSLTVKDIGKSKAFYETLGFEEFAGDITQNWLIMKNGDTAIGLFQGMLESNIMTFNPGWDQTAQAVDPFDDIRSIQRKLKAEGIEIIDPVDESSEGPGSLMVVDPDGNTILLDQHR